MSIKFICGCGEHFTARDEVEARRSLCPHCGSPVEVRPPETPESLPADGQEDMATVWETLQGPDRPIIRPPSGRRKRLADREREPLEEHWYQCLLYPLRVWGVCVYFAFILTLISVGMAIHLQFFLDPLVGAWEFAGRRLFGLLALMLVVGLVWSFLERVLALAGVKEVYRRAGILLCRAPLSAAYFLACFLAGPVVFFTMGWLYWWECGEPELLDWLILGELVLVFVVYQTLTLMSLTDRGRLRDLNPVAVLDLAHRLGWRCLVVVLVMAAGLVAACSLLARGMILIAGEVELTDVAFKGGAMLAVAWLSGLFWAAFFCRLLGVWCQRTRKDPASPVASVPGSHG